MNIVNYDVSETLLFDAARRPLLSVITVVYDDAAGLSKTLSSLVGLKVPFELVVVEGVPKVRGDAITLIRASGLSAPTRVVQGKDRGPYDAMNRGVLASNGEWLWFLNAGDECEVNEFADGVFERILHTTPAEWVAGRAWVVGANVEGKSFGTVDDLLRGVDTPCHQGLLFRRSGLMQVGLYNTRFAVSADYDLMCRFATFLGSPERFAGRVCTFYRGGLSGNDWRRRELENWLIRMRLRKGGVRRLIADCLRLSYRISGLADLRRTQKSV